MEIRKAILNSPQKVEENTELQGVSEKTSHLNEGISGITDAIEQAAPQPAWTDSNPHDPGIALVELLAYDADQLSYQQDQTAEEGYLQTKQEADPNRKTEP